MTTLTFLQPSLPSFRRPFYRQLEQMAPGSLRVVYSVSDRGILTATPEEAPWARTIGSIRDLPFGLMWQTGALSIDLARADVLVLWGNPRCLSTLALAIRARLRGVRIIWWGHYWSSTSREWRMSLRMLLTRVADSLLFYTDQEVAEYRGGAGLRDSRPIAALNNGLDTGPIRAARMAYVAVRRPRELLFIGRVTPKARLNLLLTALANPVLADVRLNIVGSGEAVEVLQAQTKALAIADRVVWHGATTDDAMIGPVANRCRLFVYPGEVGLSLIHGMAYGLPCVVHSDRWRHMPEIAAFENDSTGRSFAPDNATDLARTIAGLIDETDALDCFSRRCITVTDESYNTSDMLLRFLSFVERVK